MPIKQRLTYSVAALSAAIATAAISHFSPLQAQNYAELSQSTSALSEISNDPSAIADRAIYSLADPAIQFVYFPNQFVIESYGTEADSDTPASINYISVMTKADYVALKNLGDEVGDFPTHLRIVVKDNPEGLPLEDWMLSLERNAVVIDRDTVERKTLAGKESLSFKHKSGLMAYQSSIVKDAANDKIIMISYGDFISAPQTDKLLPYQLAFDQIEASLKLSSATAISSLIDSH